MSAEFEALGLSFGVEDILPSFILQATLLAIVKRLHAMEMVQEEDHAKFDQVVERVEKIETQIDEVVVYVSGIALIFSWSYDSSDLFEGMMLDCYFWF